VEQYNVILTDDAGIDLTVIKNYITDTLKAPETAMKYIQGLRKQILKLETLPAAYAIVPDEPWHSREIRRILFKNFFIYYRIDEKSKSVYILHVIYSKRNQLNALSEYK
jgi:toxin ParE1/3/4